MGPIGCPETSVINYNYSLRNNQEERSSASTSRWKTDITRSALNLSFQECWSLSASEWLRRSSRLYFQGQMVQEDLNAWSLKIEVPGSSEPQRIFTSRHDVITQENLTAPTSSLHY